jgi:hypothetical protein
VNLMTSDGRAMWGTPPRQRAGDRYLVHMDSIFERYMDVKAHLIDCPVDCCDLNARVVLSAGNWAEQPASNPIARDIEWTFVRPNGTHYSQRLTDTAIFSMPMDDTYTVRITKYRNGKPVEAGRVTLSATKDHTIYVVNNDCTDDEKDCSCPGPMTSGPAIKTKPAKTKKSDPATPPFAVLEEYKSLFKLLNAGLMPQPPYAATAPSAGSPTLVGGIVMRSADDNLCGSGQTDPPDPSDPPDPPPGGGGIVAMKFGARRASKGTKRSTKSKARR